MKQTILIVDDDLDFIDSLMLFLLDRFNVEVATDTVDITGKVRDANPDLILLDVMFPEDPNAGFNAARDIVRDETLRTIPIIMLSAVNQKSNLAFNFSDKDISKDFMPVWEFVEKPVEPNVLLNMIGKTLQRAQEGNLPRHLS